MSRNPALLVTYLEAFRRRRTVADLRIAISVSKSAVMFLTRRSLICLASQSTGVTEPVMWGVALDTRLSWSPHTGQVRRKADKRLGPLGAPLNGRSLSNGNGVVLYEQPIHLLMDYLCPEWRFAIRTLVTKLQVLTVQVSSPCWR